MDDEWNIVRYKSGDIKYVLINGVKIHPIDINKTLTVNLKQWSRMIEFGDRDLIVKEGDINSLYDAITGNKVAIYDKSLNKKKEVIKINI